MTTIWLFLMMVAMVFHRGVCLSMPGDDHKEPWTAESSAHEEPRESKAKFISSLDWSTQKPILQKSLFSILDTGGILDKVLHHVFGFVGALHKDSLLATDAVDESWAKWIQNVHQLLPFIPIKYVEHHDIENPKDDVPSPLWDYLLAFLLKGHRFVSVDDVSDEDSDEEGKEENAVSYTTINFDPIGQLFGMIRNIAKSVKKFDSGMNWWESLEKNLKTYSLFSEANTYSSGKEDIDFDLGIFDYFKRGFTIGEYDLLKLAINSLILVGFRSLFWRTFFPIRGVDDVGSSPDYLQDYDYGDDDEEDDYSEYDEEEEEEEDDYGYDEEEEDDYGYDEEEDEEEEGYYQYDGDDNDGGQEEEGYHQYNGDDEEDQEQEGYYQFDDGDDGGQEEGNHQHSDNSQGEEEGYFGFDDHGYQEANQGFDQNAHQEVGHNANPIQSAYQGLEGANQGSNHGSDQDQGLHQGFDGLHQSSYVSYNEALTGDFNQNTPEGGETETQRHATDWPRPTYHNLSPEFTHGRNNYRDSYSERRDDTHPRNHGYTRRGSNRLRWSDIYKNNYGYRQGSGTGDSYAQSHPFRYSYSYEQGNLYRNSYGQQYPSYVYRRNRASTKDHGPGGRRSHASPIFSIFGKK